jgi:hypothetical protein
MNLILLSDYPPYTDMLIEPKTVFVNAIYKSVDAPLRVIFSKSTTTTTVQDFNGHVMGSLLLSEALNSASNLVQLNTFGKYQDTNINLTTNNLNNFIKPIDFIDHTNISFEKRILNSVSSFFSKFKSISIMPSTDAYPYMNQPDNFPKYATPIPLIGYNNVSRVFDTSGNVIEQIVIPTYINTQIRLLKSSSSTNVTLVIIVESSTNVTPPTSTDPYLNVTTIQSKQFLKFADLISPFTAQNHRLVNSDLDLINISPERTRITGTIESKRWRVALIYEVETPIIPPDLRTASLFTILCKTGVTSTPSTFIKGDIGISPIAAAAFVGFANTISIDGTFSSASTVTGKMLAANYASPTPQLLVSAINDMKTAYDDTANRPISTHGNRFNLGGTPGIGGYTLVGGVYNWTTDITFTTNVYIHGTIKDVFILQTTGNLIIPANIKVILSGGVISTNVYWKISGYVTLAAGAHLQGIILCNASVVFGAGCVFYGKIYANTALTLGANTTIN